MYDAEDEINKAITVSDTSVIWRSTAPERVSWQVWKFSFLDALLAASHLLPESEYPGPQYIIAGHNAARLLETLPQFCGESRAPDGSLKWDSGRVAIILGTINRWNVYFRTGAGSVPPDEAHLFGVKTLVKVLIRPSIEYTKHEEMYGITYTGPIRPNEASVAS